MADTIFRVNNETERALIQYGQQAHMLMLNQFSMRSYMEEIDRYYQREGDWTSEQIRARIANRAGDKKKFQNVTVPIVMPQVESALGYLVNVFCTGYPVMGVGADPEFIDAALQMETIIEENSMTAGWVRQMIMFFRDGLKYNLHGMECDWQEKKVASIQTDLSFPNSAKPSTTLWKGNVLKRLDLYNTFWDPRVSPAEVHEHGEFAGYVQLMSRVRMKKFMNDLTDKIPAHKIVQALGSSSPVTGFTDSGNTPFSYYQPLINPQASLDRTNIAFFDWEAWAFNRKQGSQNIDYKNIYQVTTLYGRIMPSDFGMKVPEENTPQVWKFIIVNGQVVIYAERKSNAHGFIPMFFGQPLEDGLDYQTKSFAANVVDMQDIASAMWNGFIASKRRLVGDRVLYDPLRVRKEDINSDNPAAKIPVRPAAYGKPVNEAVYQFPYKDEQTNSFIAGAEAVNKMAMLINNQNPAQQGQFVKGNKTRREYEDIMGHGNVHNRTMAIMSEQQVMVPLKEAIKLNILQYQPEEVLYNRDQGVNVAIKPEDLRKAAVHFKIADGMLPEEKMFSGEELANVLQMFGSAPQIAAGYQVAPMISYIFKLRGVDLRPFEKSPLLMAYEQQLAAWSQAAQAAAQKGIPFDAAQPQMPPELVAELQGKQTAKSPKSKALEATQG
jgi:hypothetical protein